VVLDRQLAEELAALGNEAYAACDARLDFGGAEIVAGVAHAPGAGQQAHQGAEQRRLAGAVRADHGDDRSLLHAQRDAVQRLDLAVADFQLVDFEQRRTHSIPPRYASSTAASVWIACGAPSASFSPKS